MEKEEIIKYLENNDVEHKEVLIEFLKTDQEHYLRTNLFGHITGSSFILNNELDKALLILHKKYNKWVAPGGHVDENENAQIASARESGEEVGLYNLELLTKKIFDIDIHKIPEATKNGVFEPSHWHFDVRYIYKAENNAEVTANLSETKGAEWNTLESLSKLEDVSIKRQAEKAIKLVSEMKLKSRPKIKF